MLEIAAGTGLVTKHLLVRLPTDARLIATDLNEAMIEVGKTKIAPDPRLEWKIADAGALPFPDQMFDAAVCQFGLMFFPDKVGALREARRVLKPRGSLILNVWGSLAENPIGRIAHETIGSFFPLDPPQFYITPFGLDHGAVERTFEAGFDAVTSATVDTVGESVTAEMAAKGLVFGSPVLLAIQERRTVAPEVIMHAIAARLAKEGGAAPMQLPMRARVFTARK